MINTRTLRAQGLVTLDGPAWSGTADRQGRAFLGVSGSVDIFAGQRAQRLGAAPGGALPLAVAVDEGTQRLFTAQAAVMLGSALTLGVADARTGHAIKEIPLGFMAESLAVDEDRRRVLVSGLDAHQIEQAAVIDTRTLRIVRRLTPTPGRMNAVSGVPFLSCNNGDPGCRQVVVAVDQGLHEGYVLGADNAVHTIALT